MAGIDRLAALWSMATVASVVGIALAMSSAEFGSVGTGGNPSTPSSLCGSHGYKWDEEHGFCHMGSDDLCSDWGGHLLCEPGYLGGPDEGLQPSVCRLICAF